MWVRRIQKLALKNAQRVDVMETLQNHKTIKMTRDYLESAKKHNYGTIVERYLEDEQYQSACTNMVLHGYTLSRFEDWQYQMHMHEQGYTQSDMEEFDRVAHENSFHVTSSDEPASCRDQS